MSDNKIIIQSYFRNSKSTITEIFDILENVTKDNSESDGTLKELLRQTSTWAICEYIEEHFPKREDGSINFVNPFF